MLDIYLSINQFGNTELHVCVQHKGATAQLRVITVQVGLSSHAHPSAGQFPCLLQCWYG